MSRGARPAPNAVITLPPAPAPWVTAVLCIDAILCVAGLVATFVVDLALSPWILWGARVLLLLGAITSVESARLSGNAIVWRRRLGLLFVVGALWRDGPLSAPHAQAAVAVWTGVVWIALFVAARAIQRAVVEQTGAEGLPEA